MMYLRRFSILFVLALFALGSVTACGGDDDSGDSQTDTTEQSGTQNGSGGEDSGEPARDLTTADAYCDAVQEFVDDPTNDELNDQLSDAGFAFIDGFTDGSISPAEQRQIGECNDQYLEALHG